MVTIAFALAFICITSRLKKAASYSKVGRGWIESGIEQQCPIPQNLHINTQRRVCRRKQSDCSQDFPRDWTGLRHVENFVTWQLTEQTGACAESGVEVGSPTEVSMTRGG